MCEHLGEILVAPAGETDEDDLRVHVERPRERMSRLERRDDALRLGQPVERRQRLLVRGGDIASASGVPQERVLGADSRIVEPGRDRVRVGDLAVLIREDPRPRPVQDGRTTAPEAAAPAASTPTSATSSSSTNPANSPMAFEPPPTQATTASGSRPTVSSACCRASRPMTDWSSAHDRRVRMRPDAGADEVVRRLDVRDPVANRLARRLLQRARTELDRLHLGPEEPHALDVGMLSAHVLGAHVDDALEPEPGAHGGRRDAVLAGAGLRAPSAACRAGSRAAPDRPRC